MTHSSPEQGSNSSRCADCPYVRGIAKMLEDLEAATVTVLGETLKGMPHSEAYNDSSAPPELVAALGQCAHATRLAVIGKFDQETERSLAHRERLTSDCAGPHTETITGPSGQVAKVTMCTSPAINANGVPATEHVIITRYPAA